MERRVTEADLSNFAAVGFPAPVPASENVEDADLMASALRVFESPTPRLVEAASLALVELSRRKALHVVREFTLTDAVARRLGYVVDRLGAELEDEGLAAFARAMSEYAQSDTPLLLTDVTTNAYMRQLLERADAINRVWAVYGDVNLRFLRED